MRALRDTLIIIAMAVAALAVESILVGRSLPAAQPQPGAQIVAQPAPRPAQPAPTATAGQGTEAVRTREAL